MGRNKMEYETKTACFNCEYCGKFTRQTDNNTKYCKKCYNELK